MTSRIPPLDAALLEALLHLRATVIAETTEACARQQPALFARLGPQAHEICAEDLGFHLDFLLPALESGDLAPFIAYLDWLSEVLSSRGIPVSSLRESLDLLAGSFTQHLGADADLVRSALHLGCEHLTARHPAPSYDLRCPAAWEETQPFGAALLDGNRRTASALFNQAMDRESSLPGTEVHVIQPAMYAVGRRWQQNQISVAQEHLATAMAQTLMAQGFARARVAPDNGRTALLACMAGNQHSLGLRMVADALEVNGWTTHYLGANTPLAALLDQVRHVRPELIGLSASLPQHLRGLRAAINTLRSSLGEHCPPIGVGGLVFNQFPALAQTLGAPLLGSDALQAVEAAEQLLGASRTEQPSPTDL